MRRAPFLIVATAMLAPLAGAAANDSVAEHAAGGLVLKQSAEIDMVSEDLYVSAERIRVRYLFRNRSARDVRTTVAFPLPDRDLAAERESDASYPADFATRVEGRAISASVERKALLGTTDHSARLQRLGVPIAPGEDGTRGIVAALNRLPPAEREQLRRLGLVEIDEYDAGRGVQRDLVPLWTVRATYYWDQVFPAGRDLRVEHDYRPGTGASAGVALAFPDYRNSAEGRRAHAQYCTDRTFLAALDRLSAAGQRGGPAITEQRVGYVLTTGANWRSPIGDFRLVVDKGSADAIVSFCGTGLTRISPTQFEMRRRNWRPDRDLAVLIVRRARGE